MPRSRLPLAVILLVVGLGIGGFIAYDQVLSGDSVAPLELPSSSPSTAPADAPSDAPSDAGSPATIAASPADGSLAGTWIVSEGSLAGYRVRERLANLDAESDAVGRTSDVTGSITIEDDGGAVTLTAGTLTVDTTTIRSDEDRRDNRLRTEGLQTDQFPTATFTLTQSVEIPAAAVGGSAADVTLRGDLTLHGVTRPVSIPAQARLGDGTIQVAGSLTFPLADFDIVAPNVGGFILSIADEGTLEFAVAFARG